MFIGGYVSAAGLGLTCPEWPLCPSGVLPTEEYLVEWSHRLVAATTGALVISTMVACIINKNADFKIKLTDRKSVV
jgi:cytochrome c oxidase assembly protein subunit 15